MQTRLIFILIMRHTLILLTGQEEVGATPKEQFIHPAWPVQRFALHV